MKALAKTIGEIVINGLDLNGLSLDMIYDRTLYHSLPTRRVYGLALCHTRNVLDKEKEFTNIFYYMAYSSQAFNMNARVQLQVSVLCYLTQRSTLSKCTHRVAIRDQH